VEQFGDAHSRHQCVDARGKILGGRGLVGAHWRDRELAVLERDTFDLAAREPISEAFQPPVEFTAAIGDPEVTATIVP